MTIRVAHGRRLYYLSAIAKLSQHAIVCTNRGKAPVKVVIADAQNLFRTLLEYWIKTDTQLSLAGATGSGTMARKWALKGAASVLILDPLLPEVSGLHLSRELAVAAPDVRLIAVYENGEPFIVDRMLRLGFHACVSKREMTAESLKNAVDSVSAGTNYFCRETCRVQNWLDNDPASFVRLLSAREQQVLSLIGAGMNNTEIGQRLVLSPATVQTHRRNLFRKLGMHDTPSLMRYAAEAGFWNPTYGRLGFEPWTV